MSTYLLIKAFGAIYASAAVNPSSRNISPVLSSDPKDNALSLLKIGSTNQERYVVWFTEQVKSRWSPTQEAPVLAELDTVSVDASVYIILVQ